MHCSDGSVEQAEDDSPEHSDVSCSPPEDDLDPFDAVFASHTVTFKCMGTTKDANHQEALRITARTIKEG